MPVYLAYQFEPRQLTKKRLRRILEDWVEFELYEFGFKDSEDFLKELVEDPILAKIFRGKTLLDLIGHIKPYWPIREQPLLYLYLGCCKKHSVLRDFSGLFIGDCHTLQAIPEMERLKPTMDAYLRNIGINYVDRSTISLD